MIDQQAETRSRATASFGHMEENRINSLRPAISRRLMDRVVLVGRRMLFTSPWMMLADSRQLGRSKAHREPLVLPSSSGHTCRLDALNIDQNTLSA